MGRHGCSLQARRRAIVDETERRDQPGPVAGRQDLRERYAAIEAEPAGGAPEQFAAFVKTEAVKWADVVKKSGAKVE